MGVSTAGLRFGSRAGRRAGDRSRAGVVYARVETREKPTSGIADMSSQMKQMRAQMEEDEDLNTLMAGLRGSNIDDSDFAADGVQMQVVDLEKLKAAGDDELPLYYDPELIAQYWSKRPAATAQRVLQLLGIAGGFISGIISDIALKKTEENSVKRAIQLRDIVTSLGPAYIKLGQALSIRPDILSPDAMTELQKLCDKVPSFDNKVAFDCLEAELGCKWQDVYSELGPDPVAAASLGQVYKGVLRSTGETVAVKVQRPAVLETVSIDLYLIRKLGLALREVPQINTDVVALLDEWAERFFEELDYVKEGENATKFAASIKDDLPQVVVPRTYSEFTRRKVITSQWLEGEKLSQSTADDVGDLVNIGVICYLKQLLDTGFFHADPHPGNLIRTPDGRLAILDFGLMTDIDDNIKFGMIEAIAHLIHRDYEAIVEDFVTLDFIPEGVDLKPILPPLSRVFDTALEGGGAKNINFQEVAADLAQITFDYPFRIPPYFALIIRAIGVLEGIALVGNPDFALVDEAYPYISKRLLTDDSPRLRESLKYMVYGKGKVFDADRLIDVLEAFETFRVASRTSRGNGDLEPATGSSSSSERTASRGVANAENAFGAALESALASVASLPGFPFPGLAPSPSPDFRATAGRSGGARRRRRRAGARGASVRALPRGLVLPRVPTRRSRQRHRRAEPRQRRDGAGAVRPRRRARAAVPSRLFRAAAGARLPQRHRGGQGHGGERHEAAQLPAARQPRRRRGGRVSRRPGARHPRARAAASGGGHGGAPRARAPTQLARRGEDHPRGVRGGGSRAGARGEPVGKRETCTFSNHASKRARARPLFSNVGGSQRARLRSIFRTASKFAIERRPDQTATESRFASVSSFPSQTVCL
jgi:aarF domain-containing kinase